MTIEQQIQSLITSVVDKATRDDTPLTDSTDALKAVTGYLQVMLRFKGARPDEGASFKDFGTAFQGDADGEPAAVRGSDGRGTRN